MSNENNIEQNQRINNIQFFAELPQCLSDGGEVIIKRLPKSFVESADKELILNGELVNYVRGFEKPNIEVIKFNEITDKKTYFSNRARSPLWEVYHAKAIESGVSYYILIEFNNLSPESFNDEEFRKRIYLDYEELFVKKAYEFLRNHQEYPEKEAKDRAKDYAINRASNEVMIKYGVPNEKIILDIISEGATKWSKLKFGLK